MGKNVWTKIWKEDKVDHWFGKSVGGARKILDKYWAQEHEEEERQRSSNKGRQTATIIPDWACAYAIIHLNYQPTRKPVCDLPDWGMDGILEDLRRNRGGEMPPGIARHLPVDVRKKLRKAYEIAQRISRHNPTRQNPRQNPRHNKRHHFIRDVVVGLTQEIAILYSFMWPQMYYEYTSDAEQAQYLLGNVGYAATAAEGYHTAPGKDVSVKDAEVAHTVAEGQRAANFEGADAEDPEDPHHQNDLLQE